MTPPIASFALSAAKAFAITAAVLVAALCVAAIITAMPSQAKGHGQ